MEEAEDLRESDNELHPTLVGGGIEYRGAEPVPPYTTTNTHGQDRTTVERASAGIANSEQTKVEHLEYFF